MGGGNINTTFSNKNFPQRKRDGKPLDFFVLRGVFLVKKVYGGDIK